MEGTTCTVSEALGVPSPGRCPSLTWSSRPRVCGSGYWRRRAA